MDDLVLHRLQFAFTVIYHYLFPQLTMGLALLIVLMKARGLWSGGERWNDAARFWIRIFGINFAVGVVTGIPMEFQFGTNWARFSRYAGSVIGQTLAMEGLFAFFLESSFLFVLVWGERRLSKLGHFFAAGPLSRELLDWYTILTGVFALVALAAHGALFLAWKTDGPVQARSHRMARWLWIAVAVLWPIVTIASQAVNPSLFPGMGRRWLATVAVFLALAGIVVVFVGLRRVET